MLVSQSAKGFQSFISLARNAASLVWYRGFSARAYYIFNDAQCLTRRSIFPHWSSAFCPLQRILRGTASPDKQSLSWLVFAIYSCYEADDIIHPRPGAHARAAGERRKAFRRAGSLDKIACSRPIQTREQALRICGSHPCTSLELTLPPHLISASTAQAYMR
ncbi:hypothetical protein VTI28DRAFT_3440 [Corynascus sepedonium]